jgi:hypothetical protein
LRKFRKIAIAALMVFAALSINFVGTSSAAATACPGGQLQVSTGCASREGAQRHIETMVREAMPELGLRATIMRVDTGEEPLVNRGFGNSMKGVPASPKMYQNPFIDGYTGISAYLKAQDISVGIVTTQLPQSSNNGVGNASILLAQLSEYLSPDHVIVIPPPA